MLTAWRIVKKQFSATAFDGEGARQYGGRWSSPGVPVVYVASSRALAVLEVLVHLDRSALLTSFVLVPCEFEERLLTSLDRATLPDHWRGDPPPPELAILGDTWVRQGRSAVLAVPSAIIADETNFLLNPAHPEFSTIRVGAPQAFEIDLRLIR